MAIIATPIDFLGINYSTRKVYTAGKNVMFKEVDAAEYPKTAMGWEVVPSAFVDLLTQLDKRFKLPNLYITENGAAFDDALVNDQINDLERIDYIEQHLWAVEQAMALGVSIKGYFVWSLLDNFEWSEGYTKRFGIVYVDYQSQKRTLKQSAHAYKALISARNSAQ